MLHYDLNGLNIQAAEIGFYDEESQKADLVQNQAGLFKKLFAIDPGNTLIQEIKKEIDDNKNDENYFYNLFKKRSWPLFV